MSNFGLICDVCGREVQGYTLVNGMKFCAKCYQETFGNNTSKFVDLLNTEMYGLKISNLEHKLEEKDQRIAELEEQLKNAIVLPCIKKHTTYLDIDSGFVEVAWYVIFKQNGYGDEIFTIKCRSEEEALVKLKELGE